MTQKFFVHKTTGVIIGSFDVPDKVEYDPETGEEISRVVFAPENGIEAASFPVDNRQIYDKKTKTWSAVPSDAPTKDEKLFAALKQAAPAVFTDAKINEIKG